MKDQAEKAYMIIREKLLSGMLVPQSRLTEQQFSEEIGVNRGDIRQALARLLAEGLVVKGKKGGFFVKEFTKEDLKELYEVRFILESAAATLVSVRATEEDYDDLSKIADHIKLMADNGYDLGVYEADLRFHMTLVKAAHNKKLHDMYMKANIPLTGIHGWKNDQRIQTDNFRIGAEEHASIVEYLRNGSIDKVVELLKSSYHWLE